MTEAERSLGPGDDALDRLISQEREHPATDSSRVTRQLVLAYARGWPFDLSSLRHYDRANYRDAMTVIDSLTQLGGDLFLTGHVSLELLDEYDEREREREQ